MPRHSYRKSGWIKLQVLSKDTALRWILLFIKKTKKGAAIPPCPEGRGIRAVEKMKKPLKILIYVSVFFMLNAACKKLTDNFSTNHLIKPASQDSKWNLHQDSLLSSTALKQTYKYLDKGKQAHVFISEDGQHILKLLKPAHPHFAISILSKSYSIGLSTLPFAQSLSSFFYEKKQNEQRDLDFLSYTNSFNLLKEETELEYLHLAETDHLQQKLTIYDKIGVLHTLDLDKTCFILQKKADLLYPTLAALILKNELEKAKILIDNFVHLSFQFIDKDIVNPTTIEKNFGCIGLKPVQIDVGRVLTALDLGKTPRIEPEHIYRSTRHMKKWLTVKSPPLCQYLEESIEVRKKKYQETNS